MLEKAAGPAVFIIMAVIMVAFSIVGATQCSPTDVPPATPGTHLGYGITRYIDREAGVVCWLYDHSIACLPLAATRLDP
jgi:hypothetical protein